MKAWENSKKLWKHSSVSACSYNISCSPNFHLFFYMYNLIETVTVHDCFLFQKVLTSLSISGGIVVVNQIDLMANFP